MNVTKQILNECLSDETLMAIFELDLPEVSPHRVIRHTIKFILAQIRVYLELCDEMTPDDDDNALFLTLAATRVHVFSLRFRRNRSLLEEEGRQIAIFARDLANQQLPKWDDCTRREALRFVSFCINYCEHVWDVQKILPTQIDPFDPEQYIQEMFYRIFDHVFAYLSE